jgi:predicted nucleic acid-binding protein
MDIDELSRQFAEDLRGVDIRKVGKHAKTKSNERAKHLGRFLSKHLAERMNVETFRVFTDTNLFVAAIRARRNNGSLRLLLRLVEDEKIELLANDPLLLEYSEFGNILRSVMAKSFYNALIDEMRVENPREEYVEVCRSYFPAGEYADIVHAATCLQTNSILITNDKHFDKVRDDGIVETWSIGEGLRKLVLPK